MNTSDQDETRSIKLPHWQERLILGLCLVLVGAVFVLVLGVIAYVAQDIWRLVINSF